ncbi:MAG: TolC family protein [Wolinella sp.]
MAYFWLFSILLPLASLGEETLSSSILSDTKREILELSRKQNDVDSSKLELGWLAPLNLSYSDSRDLDYNPNMRTKSFTIGISQPIFKSGAILARIKGARAKRDVGALEIELEERRLITRTVGLIFTLHELELEIEKQELLAENTGIDVERKREQFNTGFSDSSELDNAILAHNEARARRFSLLDSHAEAVKNLNDISDIKDYHTVQIPRLFLVKEDDFMKKNLNLKKTHKNELVAREAYRETLGSYLPQISLEARYHHQHNNNSRMLGNDWNDYKTFGATLTLPLLDPTISFNLQSAKISELKASLEHAESKKAEENLHKQSVQKLKNLAQKIALAKEDVLLYDSLLADSIARKNIGDLTEYDVKIMQNSRRMREIDTKIYELQEQKILLDLYERARI